ncbi:MAG: 50S ribosomal protein L30 [Spirochaetes bacterium]|nr:50S ribosomal protein L30 [Spirochaetota bacterium]
MAKKVQITLMKSVIRQHHSQKDTVRALGFSRHVRVVEKDLTPVVQGMINKVSHLLSVREVK